MGSQQVISESNDFNEKISLLEENVQSLLSEDQNINDEIRKIKLNVELVNSDLVNQLQQIDVSLLMT